MNTRKRRNRKNRIASENRRFNTVHRNYSFKQRYSYQDKWGQWLFKYVGHHQECFDLEKTITDDLLQKVVEEIEQKNYMEIYGQELKDSYEVIGDKTVESEFEYMANQNCYDGNGNYYFLSQVIQDVVFDSHKTFNTNRGASIEWCDEDIHNDNTFETVADIGHEMFRVLYEMYIETDRGKKQFEQRQIVEAGKDFDSGLISKKRSRKYLSADDFVLVA